MPVLKQTSAPRKKSPALNRIGGATNPPLSVWIFLFFFSFLLLLLLLPRSMFLSFPFLFASPFFASSFLDRCCLSFCQNAYLYGMFCWLPAPRSSPEDRGKTSGHIVIQQSLIRAFNRTSFPETSSSPTPSRSPRPRMVSCCSATARSS